MLSKFESLIFLLYILVLGAVRCDYFLNEEKCPLKDVPVVRKLEDIPQDDYGRSGLAHMTVVGALLHGMKELEVWLQTFAPGSGTPIHRHDCEEIFLTLKGRGTLYLAQNSGNKTTPGEPSEFSIFQNSTFAVPVNLVHQVRNTALDEDLQLLVIISRPPAKIYTYNDWFVPHASAKLAFPYPWDRECLSTKSVSCGTHEGGYSTTALTK